MGFSGCFLCHVSASYSLQYSAEGGSVQGGFGTLRYNSQKYPASLADEELEGAAPAPKSALAWPDLADRRIVCDDMRSGSGVGLHGGNSETAQGSFSLVGQRQMD